MIRLEPPPSWLSLSRRFGLETLVDLSRLIPIEDPDAAAPRLSLVDEAVDLDSAVRAPERLFRTDGDRVILPAGLLDHVVSLVGATAEQLTNAVDRHGRVPPSENVLVGMGLERNPVVSRMAVALREAAAGVHQGDGLALVAPWPEGRRWAVAMSHDVDVVSGWPLFLGLRVGELVRKKEFGLATRSLGAGAMALFRDPVDDGVAAVLDQERRVGAPATWFLLAGRPTVADWRRGDVTYSLRGRRARKIVARITVAGHAVGLHGSLRTTEEPGRFDAERAMVEAAADRPPIGVRQHFLKLRPGHTHLEMVRAGFHYDATMGFADRSGFRLGVADVVPAWAETAGPVALDLVPLVWMDRAASKYQGIESVDRWIDDALELAAICREVDGLWTGLWHPNLTTPLGYPGAMAGFRRLMTGLAEERPWFATMDEIVAWRRRRRGVVAKTVAGNAPVFDRKQVVELDWHRRAAG